MNEVLSYTLLVDDKGNGTSDSFHMCKNVVNFGVLLFFDQPARLITNRYIAFESTPQRAVTGRLLLWRSDEQS